MGKAKVAFHELLFNTLSVDPTRAARNFMVSRITFSVNDGELRTVEVGLPHGANYETESLEVGPAVGLHYQEFRDACEEYYRRLVGEQGRAFRAGPGSSFTMKDCKIIVPAHTYIETAEGGRSGSW